MTRKELIAAVETAKAETKIALQTVYDAMNQGQKKKIVKDDAVRALFDRYGGGVQRMTKSIVLIIAIWMILAFPVPGTI